MNGAIPLCPHKGCAFKCCEFNQGNYIAMYPGEYEQAIAEGKSVAHLQVIDDDYNGGKKVICTATETATCDNGYKPLDCASYPLFPTIGLKGGVGGFIKGKKCPLTVQEIPYHVEWNNRTWAALLDGRPDIAAWVEKVRMVGYETVLPPHMKGYAWPGSPLRRKHNETNERFAWVYANIHSLVPYDHVAALAERTFERIRGIHGDYVVSWSGGKDAAVLAHLMQQAGAQRFVLVVNHQEIYWTQSYDWLIANRPSTCDVVDTGADFSWVAARSDNPFEHWVDAELMALRWKHTRQYCRDNGFSAIVTGRRLRDGNVCGKDGLHVRKDGFITYNPLHDWSHEEVLAYIHYNRLQLHPVYGWPKGWIYGPSSIIGWSVYPDPLLNWGVIHSVEPAAVERAGPYFASARSFLESV